MTKRQKLTAWFYGLNILDVIMSAIGVWILGFTELNPLINIMPIWALMLFKMAVITLVAAYILYRQFPLWFYKVICWIMVIIVSWNALNMLMELA
jgi:hypothetical protein